MSKLTKFIIFSILLTSSCSFKRNSFENYQGTINETLNPASSSLKKVQNIGDVNDMRGCGYMKELNPWQDDKKWGWGRRRVWRESSGIISYSGFSLDSKSREFTPNLTTDSFYHIVYIGPWHHAKRIGKDIRFVAYTGWGGGDIRSQFESKTPENQSISSKEFSLPEKGTKASRTTLCTVKWIANHGYNAISKVKSKNPFSKNYMVPSGEIIEVEE